MPAPPDPANPSTAPYDEAAIARARNLLNALPESVGPYRILERLGGGGMGEVYRAEQRTPIRREVALKLIKLGMDTKLVIARFEAERQALALMDHPHIAKVFDAGADDTGRPFFVMEYVRGKPITEFADQNHLTIAERLELFEQVCQAIQHAHHKGIIHRDLKPGNVLVSTHDAKPFSKVIDFGIAKAIAQRLTDETLFTAHDQFLGTPQYMSPEQAEGSVDIDTRTDVYSLGVLLYELLTGSTPFSSSELRAAAFEQLKKQIIEVDPPKPSTRLSLSQPTVSTLAASRRTEPKRLGALVRGDLDWIVMKALDKDRKRRYETPTSLARDVLAHLHGEAVEAAPPSTAYRIQKFVKKHRSGILATSAVGGALMVGALGTTWNYLKAERTASQARLARLEADAQHDAAELEAYVANIALAQIAMANASWPEARARLEACPPNRRGWEWHFLQQQASSILGELPKPARSARFDPAGTCVLTANTDNTARLWDFSGMAIVQPMRHESGLERADFIGDGTGILTVNDKQNGKGTARRWDLQGKSVGEPFEYTSVSPPVLSPDGSCFLTRPDEHTLCLSDLQGKALGKPITHDQAVAAVFTASGSQILTANTHGEVTLRLWSLTGVQMGEPILLSGSGQFAAFSPQATSILTIDKDNSVRLWDLVGHAIGRPMPHDVDVLNAVVCGDGSRIMTISRDETVRVWDLSGNLLYGAETLIDDLPYDAYVAVDCKVSHDGTRLLFANNVGGSLWDTDSGVHGRVSLPKFIDWYYPLSCQLSRDGKHVLISTAESPSNTLIADAENMVMAIDYLVGERNVPLEIAAAMADGSRSGASPDPTTDSRWIATLDEQRRLRLTDRQTGQSVRKFAGNKAPVSAFAFSPHGERLVTGDERTIWFYDTATWREVAAIRQETPVKELTFTPDGARIIVQFVDDTAQVWDIRPQAEQRQTWLARHAAQRPAREYVDKLLAGPLQTAELRQAVRNDKSLSALQKVVTQAVLNHELVIIEGLAQGRMDESEDSDVLEMARHRKDLSQSTGDARKDRMNHRLLKLIDEWLRSHKALLKEAEALIDPASDSEPSK